jgi:hypothetical protein
VLTKNAKPKEKDYPVKSGKPNANFDEAFDLESSDGEPPQTSNGKVPPHKKDSVDDDDQDLNDRVEMLQDDNDMDALINDFNNTAKAKKSSQKQESKNQDRQNDQPKGDQDPDDNAWGNFSDLNNTADMVGMESARSGFSEFDGKKDGNILNAIKQANIDNDDDPNMVKDIEEEDFEIDPAVGKKQGAKSG